MNLLETLTDSSAVSAMAARAGISPDQATGLLAQTVPGLSAKLPSFLDADGDGSITDDLLSMAVKFFK